MLMTNHLKKSIPEIISLYVLLSSNIFGESGQYPTECWNWIGALDSDGYGQLTYRHKHYKSHRFLYEYWRNVKLGNSHIDHLCRNRSCVNPYHLQPVTLQENLKRGSRANKTHCDHGHELTYENTTRDKNGWRSCRQCRRDSQKRYMKGKSCL